MAHVRQKLGFGAIRRFGLMGQGIGACGCLLQFPGAVFDLLLQRVLITFYLLPRLTQLRDHVIEGRG